MRRAKGPAPDTGIRGHAPAGNFCTLTIKWHVFLQFLSEMSISWSSEIGTFFTELFQH